MEDYKRDIESDIYCLVSNCVNNTNPACNLKVVGIDLSGMCAGMMIPKPKKKDKKTKP